MWKRFLVIIIALVGTFSVVYVANSDLFAVSTSIYASGGSITGRVNMAPTGMTNANFGFKKGDKISMGTQNPNTTSKETVIYPQMVWTLVDKQTYTDYGCANSKIACNSTPLTSWYSLSYDSIGKASAGLTKADFKYTVTAPEANYVFVPNLADSNFYTPLKSLSNQILANSGDNKILSYTNLTLPHSLASTVGLGEWQRAAYEQLLFFDSTLSNRGVNLVITPISSAIDTSKSGADFTFHSSYWSQNFWNSSKSETGRAYINLYFKSNGTNPLITEPAPDHTNNAINGTDMELRPAAFLDLRNVVFATSKGTNTKIGEVTAPYLNGGYTNLYTDAKGAPMKPRVENSTLTCTFKQIENNSGNKITSVVKGSTILLNADANYAAGGELGGETIISALIFDGDDNEFLYYIPISKAVGANGKYALNLENIPVGNYKIGLVNEAYNDTSTAAADSSKITPTQSLTIVNDINYTITNTPQTGASIPNTYEYSKNVSPGMQVATVETTGGVNPITYSLTASKDSTHTNDYKKFVIEKIDGNNLKIKVGTDALNVGEYYFEVQSLDASGYIKTAEVIISVKKTTPTLEFDNTTENPLIQKDLLLGGSPVIGKIITSNTDLNVSTAYKPAYTLSGNSNVLSMGGITDIKSYTINIASSIPAGKTLPDTYTLNVDLPETPNFKKPTSTISRTYYVYKALSNLTYTGVDTLSTTDAVASYSIGSLSAVDGVSKYTYAKTVQSVDGANHDAIKGKDNDKINVDKDNGAIELNQKLDAGTYYFKLKVTDAKGGTAYKTIELTVSAINQSQFAFKKVANGTPIDKLSVPYEANSKKFNLILEGGSGNGAVACKIDDGQQMNVIDVNMVNGKCVATIKNASSQAIRVVATKEADGHYNKATATIDITITEAVQAVEFDEDTLKIKNKLVSAGTFNIVAIANGRTDLTTSNTIKYSAQDSSICTVSETMGIVKPVAKGTCTLTAVNDEANYERAEVTVQIKLMDDLNAVFNKPTTPVSVGTVAVKIADITTTGGDEDYSYIFNPASSLLTIDSSGNIKLKSTLTTSDLTGRWDADKNKYVIHEKVTVSDKSGNSKTIDIDIECTGTTLNASFNGATNRILHVPFTSAGADFTLSLKDNVGGGDVTYSIVSEDTTGDILDSVTASGVDAGKSYMKRASNGVDDYAVVKAVIAPKNGYLGQEITVKIYIDKATQDLKFDGALQSDMAFKQDDTFTLLATSTPLGATISYDASPSNRCTINGDTVKMVSQGTCKVSAKATRDNYSDVEITKDIRFYQGLGGNYVATNHDLEAKDNGKTIEIKSILTGHIEATGGVSGNLKYTVSSNVGGMNAASSLFTVSESDGDVALIRELKAEDLEQFATYDTQKNVYLLKIQVDVIDGKDTKTIDCVIEIKGAPLSDLAFNEALDKEIKKTYTSDASKKYFNLELTNNNGSGSVTYRLKSGSGIPTEVIALSGTGNKKVEIRNADEQPAIVIADIEQSKGYAKTQIEVKVKIDKAQLTDFNFTDTNDRWLLKGDGEDPLFTGYPSGATIVMTSSDPDMIAVSGSKLTAIEVGQNVTISATTPQASDVMLYRNYEQKTVTKKYNVYSSLGGEIKITAKNMQADSNTANANKLIGSVSYNNGKGPVSKAITEGANYFILSETGNITLKNPITRTDLSWDSVNKKYYIPLTITLQDDESTVPLSVKVEFLGAELDALTFKDASDDVIKVPYALDGQYTLGLKNADDTPYTGNAMYRLKNGIDDTGVVLSIENSGLIYMGEASIPTDDSVIIEAVVEPKDGYAGAILECVFEISQIEQDFEFTEPSISMSANDATPRKLTFTNKGYNNKLDLDIDTIGKAFVKVTGTTTNPSLTAIKAGIATVTASNDGNRNYKEREVTTSVTVYDGAGIEFQLSNRPQAETASAELNSQVGSYSSKGGLGIVDIDLDATYDGNQYFKLLNNTVVFNETITAAILNKYPYDEDEKAYVMQIQFKLTDDTGIPVTPNPIPVYVKGAPITNVSFLDGSKNPVATFKKTYDSTGQPFVLELSGKVNNTWPYGTVTYGLKVVNSTEADGSSTIITNINSSTGAIIMKSANITSGEGSAEKAYATASIAAGKGYAGTETPIECELIIEQAPQDMFKFNDDPITINVGSVTNPVFSNKLTSKDLVISTDDPSVATYDEATNIITGVKAGTTPIRATAPADRNYLSKTITSNIIVQTASNYDLFLEGLAPATYGDGPVQAKVLTDNSTGAMKERIWHSSNPEVASIDSNGWITIHKAGQTVIKLEQKTELETKAVFSNGIPFKVNPKKIAVQISNKTKYVGQQMPTFTIDTPVAGLVTGDTLEEPIYICQDGNKYVDEYTKVGTYDIEGIYDTGVNSNYEIDLKVGKLTISQDESKRAWYNIRSDVNPTQAGWYNKEVYLDLVEGTDYDYDEISDQIDGAYSKTIPVQEEGVNDKNIYFKASADNKISTPQEATIKVDQTKPQITTVTGKTINDNAFARVMNTLTLNAFYKPGSEITVSAIDNAPQASIKSSGVAKIDYKVEREVADENGNTLIKEDSVTGSQAIFTIDELGEYNICAIATDNAGNQSPQTCQKATISKIDVDVDGDGKPDFNDPNEDGCADLNIKWKDPNDPTKWIIINGDRDYDGIPDLNVDSDGDGKPNLNIDTDGDNLPDINLVILKKGDWTAGTCIVGEVEEYSGGTTSVKPQINIKTADVKFPYTNIDTNGDMKAEVNITKNGKVALNILPGIKDWKPELNAKVQGFAYDTMDVGHPLTNIDSDSDGYPDLNLDFDDDGIPELNIDSDYNNIPELNIDTDGDGIADCNLDVDDNGKPTKNVITISKWKPDHNTSHDGMAYDTMIIDRKDQLEDNNVIVEPSDPEHKFLANYSLRVNDVTDKLMLQMEQTLPNMKGRAIAKVYQMQLLKDGIEIQPDGSLRIRIPIPANIVNPQIYSELSDGTYQDIPFTVENNNFVVETDFLGTLCIIGDEVIDKETNKPEIDVPKDSGGALTDSKVAGSYTGDTTNMMAFIIMLGASCILLRKGYRKFHR